MLDAKMKRRDALRRGLALLPVAAWPASFTRAQQVYPAKPVRIVVPSTAGGAADIVARAVGQQLSDRLKQPFVVDNRPGAGGAIGADHVAKSAPDGYTLFLGDFGQLAITPQIKRSLPYQPLRDFAPVATIARVALYAAVSAQTPVATPKEFIAYLRAQQEVRDGIPGVGTPHHLVAEMMGRQAGIKITMVPYNGSPQIMPPLLAGDVNFVFSALGPALALAKAGKLRLVAVSTKEPSVLMPQVASLAEALPGFDVSDKLGLLAPAGTPPAIVERLSAEVMAIVRTPEFEAKLAELGLQAYAADAPSYARMIADANRDFGAVIQAIGLTE